MKKLRWAMDGGFWEQDMSTPRTLDGLARPVPGDPIPLSISRGTRLSRPKQIDFMQRFLLAPFVPCFSPHAHGLSLQRVFTLPFFDTLFATLLGQFNVQKFVSNVKKGPLAAETESSWMQNIGRHLQDKSLYAVNLCSEILLTFDDTVLFSMEKSGDKKTTRKKAVLHHKFPNHNLTVVAASSELFINTSGIYWDVPLSVEVDLASSASDSGLSYHLCAQHNSGSPKQFEGDQNNETPTTLLPGISLKSAFSYKKNIDIWRSEGSKMKMVQPYDMFLSSPHMSASGIFGAVMTASFGDNSLRTQVGDESPGLRGFSFHNSHMKAALSADAFASTTFTAQYGNFQRLFFDLTRLHARLDFPSGSKLIYGAASLAHKFFSSQHPSTEALQAICPTAATLSLQQQIVGPFSFRVETEVASDFKNGTWNLHVDQPVFAIEHALQILGSAKAVAWYSPKHKEFMMELRFFEM